MTLTPAETWAFLIGLMSLFAIVRYALRDPSSMWDEEHEKLEALRRVWEDRHE